MPLVRIDMLKKTDPTFAQRVGKIVYESMRTAINVPEHDNFQILTEHDERHFSTTRITWGSSTARIS